MSTSSIGAKKHSTPLSKNNNKTSKNSYDSQNLAPKTLANSTRGVSPAPTCASSVMPLSFSDGGWSNLPKLCSTHVPCLLSYIMGGRGDRSSLARGRRGNNTIPFSSNSSSLPLSLSLPTPARSFVLYPTILFYYYIHSTMLYPSILL